MKPERAASTIGTHPRRTTAILVTLALAISGVLALAPAASAANTTLFVASGGTDQGGQNPCTDSSNPCATISHAVAEITSGDTTVTIEVAPGTIDDGMITVNSSIPVTITGSPDATGQNPAVVDASTTAPGGPVFNLIGSGTVNFSNLVIQGGNEGMSTQSNTVTITDSTITGNGLSSVGGTGGGIFNEAGTLTLTGSTVTGNESGGGGGIANDTGTVHVTAGSVISDNTSTDQSGGGGLLNINGTVTISNSSVSANKTAEDAGGGGIRDAGSTLTVTNSTISNNTALDSGGGIASSGTLAVTGSKITGNTASAGGGVDVASGTAAISNTTISTNTGETGGGLVSTGTRVSVAGSTISNNTASVAGGGVGIASGTATITNTTISTNTSLVGAGLYSQGAGLSVADSTFTGNKAPTGPGSALLLFDGQNTVTSSTISGNTAAAHNGGAVALLGGTASVGASIVGGNSGGNCDSLGMALHSLGFNLTDTAASKTACGFGAKDMVGSPQLGKLAGNASPTRTMLPARKSAAVGMIPTGTRLTVAGKSVVVCGPGAKDQTGHARPLAASHACTAGAVEVGYSVKAAAAAFSAKEGSLFTGREVATFTADGAFPASHFAASIKWGDGSTSAGTITKSTGSFVVRGKHRYAKQGRYTVRVTVTDKTSHATASTSRAVTVADADHLRGSVIAVRAKARRKFHGPVAHIRDSYTGTTAAELKATISWGDGTTSVGTITGRRGSFTVAGRHTYKKPGRRTIIVRVAERAPGTAKVTLRRVVRVGTLGRIRHSAPTR